MRVETKRLLDRLGQPDFQYREYEGVAQTDVERWPLFELVSRQLRGRSQAVTDTVDELQEPEASDNANTIQALVGRIARGRGQ